MVRRLLIIAALLVVVILVGVAVALSVVDADRLREPIVSRISERLERTVELRELELIVFPLPAVRLSELRVEGSTPEAPLLEVDEARLRMAFLPLFLGRVVLRAVELNAPRVRLELDAQGRPQLPGSGEPAERASSPVTEESGREMMLAVDTIRIVDGSLEVGPWRVEKLELQGRLRLDRSAEITFEADLPEFGRLREGRAELRGVGTDALSIAARGQVEALNLAELDQRLALEAELAGRVDGTFEVGVEAGTVQTAQLEFRAPGDLGCPAAVGVGLLHQAPEGRTQLRVRIVAHGEPALVVQRGSGLVQSWRARVEASGLSQQFGHLGRDQLPITVALVDQLLRGAQLQLASHVVRAAFLLRAKPAPSACTSQLVLALV